MVVADANTFLMTDLTADNSQLYGKSVFDGLYDIFPNGVKSFRGYKGHPLDSKFKKLMAESSENVRQLALHYNNLATRHGIVTR